MMKFYIIHLLFFFLILCNPELAQRAILGFTVEDLNTASEAGITANSTKTISTSSIKNILYSANSNCSYTIISKETTTGSVNSKTGVSDNINLTSECNNRNFYVLKSIISKT